MFENLKKGAISLGSIYVVLIMLVLLYFSSQLVGGIIPAQSAVNPNGQQVAIDTSALNPDSKNNLQLYTFYGTPIAPTTAPTIVPTAPIATPTAPTCQNTVLDVMIVFDRSGSMEGTQMTKAKAATKSFVDELAKNPDNRVGLSSFASTGSLSSGLTGNFALVKQEIDKLVANGTTCIACGINFANTEILTNKRAGIKHAIVLLSDGAANEPGSDSEARQAAVNSTQAGFSQSQTEFFTIGYGDSDDEVLLRQLATMTQGQFFSSPTEDQLPQIFSQISKTICT